jgi:hypothetical protein
MALHEILDREKGMGTVEKGPPVLPGTLELGIPFLISGIRPVNGLDLPDNYRILKVAGYLATGN